MSTTPEQLAALRALCPHGGDESLRSSAISPRPGRSGICDACAAKLLAEHEALKAIVRDAVEERGYRAFLQELGQLARAARLYFAGRVYMPLMERVQLVRLQQLEERLTEVSGPLPQLTHEQRWDLGDGEYHLQADGVPCAYTATVDGCTRCGWSLTEKLKASPYLRAFLQARAREQFEAEHAAQYQYLSPGSACGISGCALHPARPQRELEPCAGGAACPTTGPCHTHG